MERSEALILRRFRQGETSLVVHAFTRSHGRVPFIAKGARSGGKRATVPLVPIVLLELIWKPSTRTELQLLREVSLVNGFGGVHGNLDKLAWAQAAIEILARTLTGESPHPALFDQTVKYLEALAAENPRIPNLFLYFRIKVLEELGFALNLEIPPGHGSMVNFQPAKGGITGVNDSSAGGIRVHAGSWKMLSALAKSSREDLARLKIHRDAEKEINRVLDAAYRHAFDFWKPLESLKLLNT